jgi:hypothetical protein
MIRPTRLQVTLAYIANGDLPPLPRLVREAGLTFTAMAALCFAAGLAIRGAP